MRFLSPTLGLPPQGSHPGSCKVEMGDRFGGPGANFAEHRREENVLELGRVPHPHPMVKLVALLTKSLHLPPVLRQAAVRSGSPVKRKKQKQRKRPFRKVF